MAAHFDLAVAADAVEASSMSRSGGGGAAMADLGLRDFSGSRAREIGRGDPGAEQASVATGAGCAATYRESEGDNAEGWSRMLLKGKVMETN